MAYQQELAAKRAAEVEFRNNTFVSKDEPHQVLMGAVSGVIEIHGDRLSEAVCVVEMFLDRVFGPQPAPATAAGAPTPQPCGLLPEIERGLDRNERLLNDLLSKLRRLGDIA